MTAVWALGMGVEQTDLPGIQMLASLLFEQALPPVAAFDQQPIEARAMVSACIAAYHATGDATWLQEARRAFEWFLGRNELGLALYDTSTGGCRDGLHVDRVNQNQGAESTLAFLLALADLPAVQSELSSFKAGSDAEIAAAAVAAPSVNAP